jgi:hypothetical protein
MKVRKGKGVMDKWGKEPFAAGTLYYTSGGWKSPADFTMHNVALLIAALHEGKVDEVQLIDRDNTQYTYALRAAEKRALQARAGQ